MKRTVDFDGDTFKVTLEFKKEMSGTYMYDPDIEWTVDAVIVYINHDRYEYLLCHTQYLDYKDSLQATQPIIYFDNYEEAISFAEQYGLNIEEHGFKE